jgi:hypothetical protein
VRNPARQDAGAGRKRSFDANLGGSFRLDKGWKGRIDEHRAIRFGDFLE